MQEKLLYFEKITKQYLLQFAEKEVLQIGKEVCDI